MARLTLAAVVLSLGLLLPAAPVQAAEPPPQYGVLRRLPTPTPQAAPAPPPATPAPVPTTAAEPSASAPSPTPTLSPTATATPLAYPTFEPARGAVKGRVEGQRLLLEVPARSQFDGSEYASSNCGPAALAMVLDAFSVPAETPLLRNYANRLQGTTDVETGIALDYLASITRDAGLRALGLRDGAGYRSWTVDEVRRHVGQGHPVITLVKMRQLPHFAASRSESDHYVVVVGLDGDDLLINDPAMPAGAGLRLPVAPGQLEAAWAASSIPRQAVAIAAGLGVPELKLPLPTPEPPAPAASSKVAGREMVPDGDPHTGRPLWPEPPRTVERLVFELYNLVQVGGAPLQSPSHA